MSVKYKAWIAPGQWVLFIYNGCNYYRQIKLVDFDKGRVTFTDRVVFNIDRVQRDGITINVKPWTAIEVDKHMTDKTLIRYPADRIDNYRTIIKYTAGRTLPDVLITLDDGFQVRSHQLAKFGYVYKLNPCGTFESPK